MPTQKLHTDALKLIRKLSKWTTTRESHWEETDDPFIDNTMADIDKVILEARKIISAADYWETEQ